MCVIMMEAASTSPAAAAIGTSSQASVRETMPVSKRRSHSREKKPQILKYYHENARNKY